MASCGAGKTCPFSFPGGKLPANFKVLRVNLRFGFGVCVCVCVSGFGNPERSAGKSHRTSKHFPEACKLKSKPLNDDDA